MANDTGSEGGDNDGGDSYGADNYTVGPVRPEPELEIPPSKPLAGVLVVDLSRYLPGPMVSRLLGDLGARVLKIEEPKLGDPSRQAPPLVGGQSSLSTLLLSGHESLALDLEKPAARDTLDDLLMEADVLLESFRPGKLAQWGLDPKELRRTFPSLIICSVSGWGQEGDYAWRAGHDLGYQAVAGSLAAGGGMPAVQVADLVGGWSGGMAVVSALFRRQQTGQGCWIDQALLDAAGHSAITAWAAEADGAKGVAEPLSLTGAIPTYDLYRTRDDGTLALAILEPKFWARFCLELGRKDLVAKQFSSDPAVRKKIAELVITKTRQEWADFLSQHDIPAEPVLSPSEALEHPQVRHRALMQNGDDGLPRLGYPALIDGQRPRSETAFPKLGEHTQQVMQEHGIGTDLSPLARRRGGIGKRWSVKRWASRVATQWISSRRPKS